MKYGYSLPLLVLAGCAAPAAQVPPSVVAPTEKPVAVPTMAMVAAPTLVPPTPTSAPSATIAPNLLAPSQPATPPQLVPTPAEATAIPNEDPIPNATGGSTIKNESGRWLQVDVYDENSTAISTLNCRFRGTEAIPDNARELKIRVSGKNILLTRAGMKILIDGQENLVDIS